MEKYHVNNAAAEKIMIATWNCPVAEVVNGVQGVYCMVPKRMTGKVNVLPPADTESTYVTFATNKDLERAMKDASMAMIKKIMLEKKMSFIDTYTLASVVMDCRIGGPSSSIKTVYCMLAKNLWTDVT